MLQRRKSVRKTIVERGLEKRGDIKRVSKCEKIYNEQ